MGDTEELSLHYNGKIDAWHARRRMGERSPLLAAVFDQVEWKLWIWSGTNFSGPSAAPQWSTEDFKPSQCFPSPGPQQPSTRLQQISYSLFPQKAKPRNRNASYLSSALPPGLPSRCRTCPFPARGLSCVLGASHPLSLGSTICSALSLSPPELLPLTWPFPFVSASHL